MSKKDIGSSFDDFLSENAILDEATTVAVKRVIAWQIEQEMKAQNLNKTTMAKRCTQAAPRLTAFWTRTTPASR